VVYLLILDRDFVADVLVGKTDAVPTMWLSNGDRKYKRVPFPLPSAALSIASCDLDADGYNGALPDNNYRFSLLNSLIICSPFDL
jgi:hypothetical protein